MCVEGQLHGTVAKYSVEGARSHMADCSLNTLPTGWKKHAGGKSIHVQDPDQMEEGWRKRDCIVTRPHWGYFLCLSRMQNTHSLALKTKQKIHVELRS